MNWPEHINKICIGDCRDVLREIPDGVIQTCITSPPYWGLRDYRIPPSIWGGDPDCKHKFTKTPRPGGNGTGTSRRRDKKAGMLRGGHQPGFCEKCGAWQGCLGLEPTPDLYIDHIVEVFREVWRVLRNDGTLWLNIGDCYASDKGGKWEEGRSWTGRKLGEDPQQHFARQSNRNVVRSKVIPRGAGRWGGGNNWVPGLKNKDLAGIPWHAAFALQSDGWYLRTDVVWSKNNCLAESVLDRPTRNHEYMFFLIKSGDKLLWRHRDKPFSECVYEKPNPDYRWVDLANNSKEMRLEPADWQTALLEDGETKRYRRINLWKGYDYYYDADAVREPYKTESIRRKKYQSQDTGSRLQKHQPHRCERRVDCVTAEANPLGRLLRTVWDIPVHAFPGAHFATFPEKLIEPCILAGSTEGDLVLDPFGGSGTVAKRSKELGRRFIHIDLGYGPMARKAVAQGELELIPRRGI